MSVVSKQVVPRYAEDGGSTTAKELESLRSLLEPHRIEIIRSIVLAGFGETQLWLAGGIFNTETDLWEDDPEPFLKVLLPSSGTINLDVPSIEMKNLLPTGNQPLVPAWSVFYVQEVEAAIFVTIFVEVLNVARR